MSNETKDEEFSNKLADKALRAKCAKLECENPNDANALKIVLGQTTLTNTQRSWLEKLAGRKGKRFIFVEPKKSKTFSPNSK